MRTRTLLRFAFATQCVLTSVSWVAPAQAQAEAQVEASQRAVSLGHEALEAFERGEHEAALERFERAEAAMHSPVFVLYMARSHAALGHLLRARELYRKVESEALPDEAPEAWLAARESAETELDTLREKLPSLDVLIEGPDGAPYQIVVGDHEERSDERALLVDLDPGSYELVVRDSAGRTETRAVTLAEGDQRHRVVVRFPPRPTPKRVKRAAHPPTPAPTRTSDENEPHNLGAWTALGVGLVGVATGIAAGTIAWAEARDVRDKCAGRRCPPELEDDAATARTWANVASVGFAVGVVGLGGGLLLWDSGGGEHGRAAVSRPSLFVSGRF